MDYIKNPLFVSIINPHKKNDTKIYYFLGNVPKNILKTARNGVWDDKIKNMYWNKDDITILKNFYGTNWRTKLVPTELSLNLYSNFNLYQFIRNSLHVKGGSVALFEDIQDSQFKKETYKKELVIESNLKITYSNISIYPEDTLYDIRLKINLVTRIPIFRQFLFYFIDDNGPFYTFQTFINKIIYNIDWKHIINETNIKINNAYVDLYFEQNKNNIEINTYDKLILAQVSTQHKINKIYIIDLFDIIDLEPINDKYKLNLLYYGFVVKYWPQLTLNAFSLALTDLNKLEETYPNICPNYNQLYKKQYDEQNIFNNAHKYIDIMDYPTIITNSIISINIESMQMLVNIRNIFDQLALNSSIIAMFINFKYGIKKQYYINKKYATVLHQDFNINLIKNTLSIIIKKKYQTILTIFQSGLYEIYIQLLEDDNISFNSIINVISKEINPVIKLINNLGSTVFPTGGKLKLISDDVVFSIMTVSIYYLLEFTLQEFNLLKSSFKIYEQIGIIKIYGLQVTRIFNFIFYRGIIDKNYLYNGYNWLYEDVRDVGRQIRIIYRSDRLQIELNNIHSIEEFNVLKLYIFSMITNFVKDNKIKKNKKEQDHDIKSIRKLHDFDPNLYNINKYDNNSSNYSVLCQSSRQPIIYNEDDIKYLGKEKNKLFTYWNFTQNKPAYYLCNDKYPYLNFIINKHPKGYCLPCCKKLKDSPGTTVAKINQDCVKNKIYIDNDSENTYILSYGKEILTGRKSYIPNIVKNLLPNTYIYKVKQGNDVNKGFIYSLFYILGNDYINEIANLVKEMKHYYSLANGQASIFQSSLHLYSELINNFTDNSNPLLTVIDMNLWKSIIIDLVRYKHDVEIININTFNNNTTVDINQEGVNAIQNGIRAIFLFTDDINGTNPIVDKNNNGVFDGSICKSLLSSRIEKKMDINFILNFIKDTNESINYTLINLKNKCYGVLIGDIYLPILESAIPYKLNIPISYDIRPEPLYTKNELVVLIDKINKYRKDSIIIKKIIKMGEKIIGFISEFNLVYYHKYEVITTGIKYDIYEILYDPRLIDIEILKRNKIMTLSKQGNERKLHNIFYKLFISEFTYIIQQERNNTIRNSIKKLLHNISTDDSKSLHFTLIKLSDLLQEHSIDFIIIQDFIEFAYFNSIDLSKIVEFIDKSRFEFDYQLLNYLKKIDNKELIKEELKKVMNQNMIIGEIENIPDYYNIYTSCLINNNQFFCKNNKLIVSSKKIEDLYDILSEDIMNKSKTYILISSISGVFNYLDFIKRPYEFIEIHEIKQ